MKYLSLFAISAVSLAMSAGIASAQTIDFDQAGDTAGFTTDRFAPDGFTSGVVDGSRTVLVQSIDVSDGANNRPGGFGGAFYNTQGMKSPVFDAGAQSMSVELFVGSDWAETGRRMAGFWGEGVDGAMSVVSYPIIEYSSDALYGFGDGWRGYDPTQVATNGWVNLGGTVNYNGWNLLNISLNGANWDYSVNGQYLASVGANGSTSLKNAILQGHNTTGGVSYDIKWDNLSSPGVVPEPGTWALMIIGFGGTGAMLRNRRRTLVLAA